MVPGNTKPIVKVHQGVHVVRDDLYPGGTKARFVAKMYEQYDEIVYATPAQGGAQSAIAHVAEAMGKRCTLFVAKRKQPHDRALLAKKQGARVFQVKNGYLNVIQSKAKEYCRRTGAHYLKFGADEQEAIDTIAEAALLTGIEPDEVWCASGSGVLMRGLTQAFPNARRNAVQVGRDLRPEEVAGAKIWKYPKPFGFAAKCDDFPAAAEYDAKAWQICLRRKGEGTVLFWNVTGNA